MSTTYSISTPDQRGAYESIPSLAAAVIAAWDRAVASDEPVTILRADGAVRVEFTPIGVVSALLP